MIAEEQKVCQHCGQSVSSDLGERWTKPQPKQSSGTIFLVVQLMTINWQPNSTSRDELNDRGRPPQSVNLTENPATPKVQADTIATKTLASKINGLRENK